MTIYAKQIPIDIQESPLDIGLYDELPVIITGGNYQGYEWESKYRSLWSSIKDRFDEMCYEYEDIGGMYGHYKNLTEICRDYFPDVKWNTRLVGKVRKIINQKDTSAYYSGDTHLDLFRIVTGLDWREAAITGCIQREWAEIIYVNGQLDVDTFEEEFFNLGTEWIIHDSYEEPESVDDIEGYTVYITGCWNEDMTKRKIAEEYGSGEDNEKVVLYVCNGYGRHAIYEVA